MSDVDISVVIGFRDWGPRRLRLAVETISASFGQLRGEVIVSDYGSEDPKKGAQALTGLDVKYVYTAAHGPWSRSRALNAGFAKSAGRILVSTDADMVFAPKSMEIVGQRILNDESTGILLQCRDLPQGWDDERLELEGLDWSKFEKVARRRPRWGMGGLMAVSRSTFLRIRGFDERMQTYGGEDIDFAQRVRRAGSKLVWIEDPHVRMYHMWHPSTAEKHALSSAESADVDSNKRIMREDKTYIRNIKSWVHRLPDAPPLVSFVIATHNRCELIEQTIASALSQTVQDFEIVIVDDGSTDETKSVVESFNDPRVHYYWQENKGVAAARNSGIDLCRGQFIAVLDDDDIALPWRLEAQFEALTAGVHATFGAFANFDNTTGELALHRTKEFTDAVSADKGGAPGHSTWMVDRNLMKELRYDESLTSGIDNNFALRALRSGLTWKHSGRVHTLRRMHAGQITSHDLSNQLAAAREAYGYFTFNATTWTLAKLRKERGNHDYPVLRDAEDSDLVPYLPDHLVLREVVSQSYRDGAEGDWTCTDQNGSRRALSISPDAKWRDIAEARTKHGYVSVSGVLRAALDSEPWSNDVHAHRGATGVVSLLRQQEKPFRRPLGRVRIEIVAEGEDHDEFPLAALSDNAVCIRGDECVFTWTAGLVEPSEITVTVIDRLDALGPWHAQGSVQEVDELVSRMLGGSEGEVDSA